MRPSTIKGLVSFLGALVFATGAFSMCSLDKVEVKGDFGSVQFSVEIADDTQERAIGLMTRESMPRFSGMLFIYPEPQSLAFWMRNTLIPLDMIFIEPDGRIARIHENAVPLDETPIEGGDALLAVLEINGGLSRRLGIAEGDLVRSPGLPQDLAVWPCP